MVRRGIVFILWTSIGLGQAPPEIFRFQSGFWVNLHQFLFQQASKSDRVASTAPEWQAAVEYYKNAVVPKGEMSLELTDVNYRLSEADSATGLPAGLDPSLAAALVKAAPVYRREWWPEHNRRNLAWIDAVRPLLARYGDRIRKDMVTVYHAEWPAEPVRTDIAVYGGQFGAYTATTPKPHITMSSVDPGYQGEASLEMLFHEISHALDEKLSTALEAELAARGMLFRRRGFDHAIIFYTAGEVTRRYLPNYETYAVRNGIWEKGWPGAVPVLEKDWKPYLDGRIDWEAAVKAIVADYGVPKNAH